MVDYCNGIQKPVSICYPVSIYEDDIFKESVQSGGSFYYTTGGCDEGTVNVTNENGDILHVVTVPSGGLVSQEVNDSNVANSDFSYGATLQAESNLILPDITHTDSDSTPVTLPAQTPMVCTPSTACLNSSQLTKSGATVSYQTNDDGDKEFGQGTDFFTLDYNNKFGNTNRFTDDLGTQIYTSGIIVDWTTFNQVNDTVLCYYKTVELPNTLTNLINSQPYTKNSLSNWWVCNMAQLLHLFSYGVYRNVLNYAPFNLSTATTADSLWSSTRDSATIAYYISSLGTSLASHTGSRRALLSRTYTLTELGL